MSNNPSSGGSYIRQPDGRLMRAEDGADSAAPALSETQTGAAPDATATHDERGE